jgi:hypothetical protein
MQTAQEKLEAARSIVKAIHPKAEGLTTINGRKKADTYSVVVLSNNGNPAFKEHYILLSRPNHRSKLAAWQYAAKMLKWRYDMLILATNSPDQKVYIWSGEHQSYWRENAGGYTQSKYFAGIYTAKQAYNLCHHCGSEKELSLIIVK